MNKINGVKNVIRKCLSLAMNKNNLVSIDTNEQLTFVTLDKMAVLSNRSREKFVYLRAPGYYISLLHTTLVE